MMMEGENSNLCMEMVVKDKAEVIHLAIQKLMEDEKKKKKKKNTISDGSNDNSFVDEDEDQEEQEEDRLLLSRLLSQLESIKEDNTTKLPEPPTETMEQHSSADSNNAETKDESRGESSDRSREMATEEILKELKKVKKQNFITHCLLSVMIALTVAWQLSEVSLILKVKNKLTHPFKSVRNLITDVTKASSTHIEPPPLPTLHIPDFPHMDLPALGGLNGGDDS